MDYLDSLKDRIGKPSLLICLDSGAGDYNSLWLTNSLRGAIMADLTVEIVKEGLHSGDASGIVPSSFRIIRKLIDRIENIDNGEIIPNF